VQVDLGHRRFTARIRRDFDALTIYTSSESSPRRRGFAEASLAADWAVLNPSPDESSPN
jgi:hypothetical protein